MGGGGPGAVSHEGKHPADRTGSANRPVAPSRLLEHPHSLAELPKPHAVVADQDGKGSGVVGRTGGRSCGDAIAVADDTGQLLSSTAIATHCTVAATSVARKRNSAMSKSSFEGTYPTS